MTSRNEKPIIEVKHLSKEYQIGVDKTYKTLSESVMNGFRHPIKTLRGLWAPKETFWALKDVNFEVERGKVLGIIGRNALARARCLRSSPGSPTRPRARLSCGVGSALSLA
jgi:lipopolysaccharide transport system ATP-binding protein